jgi:hypothetical protein
MDFSGYNPMANVLAGNQQTFQNVMASQQIQDARDQRRFGNAMALRNEQRAVEQNALENKRYEEQMASRQQQMTDSNDYNARKTAMSYAIKAATPEQQTAVFQNTYKQLGGKQDISNFKFTGAGTMSSSEVKTPNGTMVLNAPTQNVLTAMDLINDPKLKEDPKALGQALDGIGASLAMRQGEPEPTSTPVAGDPKEAAGLIFSRLPRDQQTAENYAGIMKQLGLDAQAGGSNMKRYQQFSTSDGIYILDAVTGDVKRAGGGTPVGEGMAPGGSPIYSPNADPELAMKKKTAEVGAKLEKEKEYAYPKVRNSFKSLKQGWRNAKEDINDAIALAGTLSTGYPGMVLKYWPYSDAGKLSEKLETIRANIRLAKMQDMKNNSPTGATGMGAMSDAEGKILDAVQGSMNQNQDGEQLVANLERLKETLTESELNMQAAFDTDYSKYIKGDKAAPKKKSEFSEGAVQAGSDFLKKNFQSLGF